MSKKMTFRPSSIQAADDTADTRVADTISILKDDFNYVIDGFDKLDRDGKTAEALEIMSRLQQAINDSIDASASIIGE